MSAFTHRLRIDLCTWHVTRKGDFLTKITREDRPDKKTDKKTKLTDKSVREHALPASRYTITKDSDGVKGFGILVTAAGSRVSSSGIGTRAGSTAATRSELP